MTESSPLMANNNNADCAMVPMAFPLSGPHSLLTNEPVRTTAIPTPFTAPIAFGPAVPNELLTNFERKFYRRLNAVCVVAYRYTYLITAILMAPFMILLPMFMAWWDMLVQFFMPMARSLGNVIVELRGDGYIREVKEHVARGVYVQSGQREAEWIQRQSQQHQLNNNEGGVAQPLLLNAQTPFVVSLI